MDYQYERAKRRVREKKKFLRQLATYIVMSLFFIILNGATYSGTWWFMWPMMGWGIGLFIHYFKVYGLPGVGPIESEWEEKEMQKELSRMRRKEEKFRSYEEEEPLDLKEIKPQKRAWRDDELV